MRNGLSLALIAIKATTPSVHHKPLSAKRILARTGCLLVTLSPDRVKVENQGTELNPPASLRLRAGVTELKLSPRCGVFPAAARMQNDTDQTGKSSWLRTILIGRNPRRTAVRLVIIVVGVLLLRAYVLLPILVDGPSMLPNYHEHSVNVINRLAYLRHGPERGDVVAIRFSGKSIMLMKRVVGLPGETVEWVSGHLLINGRKLDEPYVKNGCSWEFRPDHWQLDDDEYYVVGDNRSMPHEDHKQGSAKIERIVGKVML